MESDVTQKSPRWLSRVKGLKEKAAVSVVLH
ncbi:hypothetical protein DESACE_00350 [Desulfurella acetivorans A63]|nr:hypothetical protein DESACE_00350 [Desulfurella acetivorans A63]